MVSLNELNIRVKSHFQIIPPEPAHILYDYCADIPRLHLGDHLLEALTLECRPAHPVVREVADIPKAVPACEVLKVFFLRRDLSRGFSAQKQCFGEIR